MTLKIFQKCGILLMEREPKLLSILTQRTDSCTAPTTLLTAEARFMSMISAAGLLEARSLDPAFDMNSYEYIYCPVRTVFPGPINVQNVQIIGR